MAKVAGVSLVLLLAACSSDSRYKRQVSGDESYLDAAPLAELHAPAGMILSPGHKITSDRRLRYSGHEGERRGW
ncbi:Outer membrane protein NlpB [Salmonella enterica subsp. enterica serovar Montevideo str. S5-403]|uniref:Outer membrane protein NlpB n=1 Tax=Salmonella enterica subsp. enterica serovar Montevideo str. S5-403 TaxID=913242 RepID=G5Q5Z9_SALMO|nr:Outer membrane protein NlpB [Salmonella enterica subsp. enterica serovar Montevideo str. S5-403]